MDTQEKQKSLFYVYCLAKIDHVCPDFENVDIEIFPVYFEDMCAVTGKVPQDEFAEDSLERNLADTEWLEIKVRQHEKVIEQIMRYTTVLPFKFGTVFKTEENIKKLLRTRSEKFQEMILYLEGKEEWGLKVYFDFDKVKSAVYAQDQRLREKEEQISSAGEGKAYFLKKSKEELEKTLINEKAYEWGRDSFQRMKESAVDIKANKIMPREITRRPEDMILNAVLLLNSGRIKDFSEILTELRTKYSEKGLIFDCTGPWPPYNFCDIPLKKV